VHLHEVVANAVKQLHQGFAEKKVEVENRIPASLPMINVDKRKFGRLFELLLKDELASLPPGSRVSLSAKLSDGARKDKQEIEVEVSDNGPGLPREALRLMFDPFVARSDSPVEYGIHLMACFFIAHHHGGRIQAKSEEGRGTSFRLRLPLNPNQAQAPQNEGEFLNKVLLSDTLWERLISSE